MVDYPHLRFDSAFVEEAVFLKAKALGEGNPWTKTFHARRERLYDSHEKDFQAFYEKCFMESGLREIFEGIVREFPPLSASGLSIFIRRVWTKKEEESELYVQGGVKTVYVGLQTLRVLDRFFLEAFLRFEFMHICDMLNAHFRYAPDPILCGETEAQNNLMRDRFRLLWDLYVEARLKKKGHPLLVPAQDRDRDFGKIFSFLDEDRRGTVLRRIAEENSLTQADLLDLAGCRGCQGVR